MMRRAAVVALIVIAACGGSSTKSTSQTVHVTYKFGGSAEAPQITYTTSTGIEQRTLLNSVSQPSSVDEEVTVDLPAGRQLTVTIEAEHYSENVRCTIISSSGQVISDNGATGLHGKATCEGIAA